MPFIIVALLPPPLVAFIMTGIAMPLFPTPRPLVAIVIAFAPSRIPPIPFVVAIARMLPVDEFDDRAKGSSLT
jgi:hypothetical protein